jgi:DMATS type aromatic prenyltransferase
MHGVTSTSEYVTASFQKSDTRSHQEVPIFNSARFGPWDSYLDVACDKLARAAEALAVPAGERLRMVALLRRLCQPWGEARVGSPRYWSNVSLEGMPFELSFAWTDVPGHELRMSFETLGEPPNPRTGLRASQEFTRRLTEESAVSRGLSIESYLKVEDLVVGPDPQGMAPMAHGVAWRTGSADPLMKIYLNPNIDGFEHGLARTAEACTRLGIRPAWDALVRHLAAIKTPDPVPVVIALDLADPRQSRIKIYLPHVGVDAASIDQQAEVAQTHVKGKFERALQSITGHGTPDWKKAPVTCMTMTPGEDLPTSATLYAPLIPEAPDDAAARDRVCEFAREEGVDPSRYVALLEAVGDRPLSESTTHNFVSYRPGERPRFAVYLSPGVYRYG